MHLNFTKFCSTTWTGITLSDPNKPHFKSDQIFTISFCQIVRNHLAKENFGLLLADEKWPLLALNTSIKSAWARFERGNNELASKEFSGLFESVPSSG